MSYIQKLCYYFTSLWLHPGISVSKFIEDPSNKRLLMAIIYLTGVTSTLNKLPEINNRLNSQVSYVFLILLIIVLVPILIYVHYRVLGFFIGKVSRVFKGKSSILQTRHMVGLTYIP